MSSQSLNQCMPYSRLSIEICWISERKQITVFCIRLNFTYKLNKTAVIKKKNVKKRASLVALWLRICLSVQGTQVRALVREDPTCLRATKPMHHNYWACALEPVNHNYWAHVLQLLKPAGIEPVLRNKRSHRNEKPAHRNKE